jgi:hypothetical protein
MVHTNKLHTSTSKRYINTITRFHDRIFDTHQGSCDPANIRLRLEAKGGLKMEHRWSTRSTVSSIVDVAEPSGSTTQARMQNLSLGGMGLVSPQPFMVGTHVVVSFSLTTIDGSASRHRLAGQVVHGGAMHAGIVFLDAPHATVSVLREVLRQPPNGGIAAAQGGGSLPV